MNDALALPRVIAEKDDRLAAAVAAQGPRLRAFVRRQVADLSEVEDIVQDRFLALISAYRLMEPIEHVAAWLRRVARNRIIDRFRLRSRRDVPTDPHPRHDLEATCEPARAGDQWPAPAADGPEAGYLRDLVTRELVAALAELPPEQRDVFVAHELDGRTFKELAAETGVGINTLLGRKHAAVRQLQRRLRDLRTELDT
jgi:RNA polymerase sigma factor (sigma-70 family)